MNPILSQGAVIVSMLANALGLLSVGVAFDRGMRAVYANAAVVFLGVGTGEPSSALPGSAAASSAAAVSSFAAQGGCSQRAPRAAGLGEPRQLLCLPA